MQNLIIDAFFFFSLLFSTYQSHLRNLSITLCSVCSLFFLPQLIFIGWSHHSTNYNLVAVVEKLEWTSISSYFPPLASLVSCTHGWKFHLWWYVPELSEMTEKKWNVSFNHPVVVCLFLSFHGVHFHCENEIHSCDSCIYAFCDDGVFRTLIKTQELPGIAGISLIFWVIVHDHCLHGTWKLGENSRQSWMNSLHL